MGLRDYANKGYNYRARQTRMHRRKPLLDKRAIFKKYYIVFLTVLIILNFIYTTIKSPQAGSPVIHPVEVRQVTQPKGTIDAQLAPFQLPSMPFLKVYKAFAETARPILIPTPTSTDSWNVFKEEAHSIAKIYGYPANLLIAQAALESAHGTSSFAINRYNYFGIGAYDAEPNLAFQYENPAQSIIDYIYVVKNNFPEAWENRSNPSLMLRLLENNSQGKQYASDPRYAYKVESTPEWSTE